MSVPATHTHPDPALTSGWEPDVPVGDTMLRRYLFHWAALCEAFALAGRGRARRTPDFAAADLGRPAGYFNAATLLRPPPASRVEEVVAEVEAFYADGDGEVMLWSAWPTPDLGARGWRLVGHPPLLLRPPAALVPPPRPPEVDVRAVADTASLADWERVAVEAYPMAELLPFAPGALADPSLLDDRRLRFSVGYLDGEPASIGTLFVEAGIASLALAATRPEARRHGLWRRHAIDRLHAAPQQWATGVFSDFSRPGAEGLGFVPLLRFTLWALAR